MNNNWLVNSKKKSIYDVRYSSVEIIVQIRDNQTGEMREYRTEDLMEEGESVPNDFIWSEGNYACDCNRLLFFLRANDEEEPKEMVCGDSRFTIRLLNAKDRKPYYNEFAE